MRYLYLAMALLTPFAFASWGGEQAMGKGAEAKGPAAATGGIVGTWKTSCECAQGMTVEFSMAGGGGVVGRIHDLGRGKDFGYRAGEEIMRLQPAAASGWTGQLLWRNTAGEHHWQPLRLRFIKGKLHGTSASEHCYEYMERAQ